MKKLIKNIIAFTAIMLAVIVPVLVTADGSTLNQQGIIFEAIMGVIAIGALIGIAGEEDQA